MDERVWTDTPIALGETIMLDQLSITRKRVNHAIIISGNLDLAMKRLAPSVKIQGLGQDVGAGDFGVRMSHDSAILMPNSPLDVKAGWYEEGFAITHAYGKYAMIELKGSNAEGFLAQGTSVNFKEESPSAALKFLGETCILVKQDASWLLFMETPMLSYFTNFARGAKHIERY